MALRQAKAARKQRGVDLWHWFMVVRLPGLRRGPLFAARLPAATGLVPVERRLIARKQHEQLQRHDRACPVERCLIAWCRRIAPSTGASPVESADYTIFGRF